MLEIAGVYSYCTSAAIRGTIKYPHIYGIDDEAMVVTETVNLLKAIIKGMKLSEKIKVIQNRQIAGVETDIILIYRGSEMPFMAIEVKNQDGNLITQHQTVRKDMHSLETMRKISSVAKLILVKALRVHRCFQGW